MQIAVPKSDLAAATWCGDGIGHVASRHVTNDKKYEVGNRIVKEINSY